MQTIQNKTQQITTAKPRKTIQELIETMKPEINKALPTFIDCERFTRIALSAVSANPALAECTSNSFLAALMTAAQLGMEPNTPLGQCYLIPYQNHGTAEVQFQLGYKGLIELAYRSGEVLSISAHTVCSNDEFEYEFGLNPILRHRPAREDRGEPVYFYAVYHTRNGGYGFDVMSIDEMKRFKADYVKSAASSYSPWNTEFEAMAKKTVLKRCLKYAPLKTEIASAVSADETVKRSIDADMLTVEDERDFAAQDPINRT